MNRKLLIEWINALKSGRYKQGKGRLKANNCYCALGVLVDIHPDFDYDQLERVIDKEGRIVGIAQPPFTVKAELDLIKPLNDGIKGNKNKYFVHEWIVFLNDRQGKTLAEIADFLIDYFEVNRECLK